MYKHVQNKDKYKHAFIYFHVCKDSVKIKCVMLKYVYTIWRDFQRNIFALEKIKQVEKIALFFDFQFAFNL